MLEEETSVLKNKPYIEPGKRKTNEGAVDSKIYFSISSSLP